MVVLKTIKRFNDNPLVIELLAVDQLLTYLAMVTSEHRLIVLSVDSILFSFDQYLQQFDKTGNYTFTPNCQIIEQYGVQVGTHLLQIQQARTSTVTVVGNLSGQLLIKHLCKQPVLQLSHPDLNPPAHIVLAGSHLRVCYYNGQVFEMDVPKEIANRIMLAQPLAQAFTPEDKLIDFFEGGAYAVGFLEWMGRRKMFEFGEGFCPDSPSAPLTPRTTPSKKKGRTSFPSQVRHLQDDQNSLLSDMSEASPRLPHPFMFRAQLLAIPNPPALYRLTPQGCTLLTELPYFEVGGFSPFLYEKAKGMPCHIWWWSVGHSLEVIRLVGAHWQVVLRIDQLKDKILRGIWIGPYQAILIGYQGHLSIISLSEQEVGTCINQ